MKNKALLLRFISFTCLMALTLSMIACNQRLDDGGNKTLPEGSLDIEDVVGNLDTDIGSADKDYTYEENGSVKISFSGNSATVSGLGASATGADVTITGSGTYIISGECADGSVTVNTQNTNKVQLVLDGLKLTNADGPALNVKNAKKVTVTLEKGTENVLSDGSSYSTIYVNDNVDGTIFSKSNLVFNGEGKLVVNGNIIVHINCTVRATV